MKIRTLSVAAFGTLAIFSLQNVHAQQPTPAGTPKGAAETSAVKVVFDDETPGVAFIEVNGERLRVNTLKKTVEHVDAAAVEKAAAAKAAPEDKEKTAAKDEGKYDFDKGDEPYDYRVVNVPTPAGTMVSRSPPLKMPPKPPKAYGANREQPIG